MSKLQGQAKLHDLKSSVDCGPHEPHGPHETLEPIAKLEPILLKMILSHNIATDLLFKVVSTQ